MEASALSRGRSALLPRSRRVLAALGDDRLVDQIRRGNEAAFEVVYDRHHRGILGFCRHMLGSREEAEDAVQQTFASAYSDLAQNDREIKLKAWLYTIARNRCLSILRARREQPAELDEQETAGLTEEVERRADLREMLADMRALPDDQREALVLFEIGDLSQAEVANVIGVDPMKVKALVFQARTTLIENREARNIPCEEIREQLATATGGALRRGPLRRHVKACEGCSDFRDRVRAQRSALALVLPVVPTAGLKESVLAAIGFGGGTGGAGAAAGGIAGAGIGASAGSTGAAGGGVFAAIGGMGAAKLAAIATLGAGALGGGIAAENALRGGSPPIPTAEASGPQAGGGSSAPAASPARIEPTSGGVTDNEGASGSDRAGDDPTPAAGDSSASREARRVRRQRRGNVVKDGGRQNAQNSNRGGNGRGNANGGGGNSGRSSGNHGNSGSAHANNGNGNSRSGGEPSRGNGGGRPAENTAPGNSGNAGNNGSDKPRLPDIEVPATSPDGLAGGGRGVAGGGKDRDLPLIGPAE